MFKKNNKPFPATFDFASLYPNMIVEHKLDESLVAKIRSYERRRIIDEIIADLESEERKIE